METQNRLVEPFLFSGGEIGVLLIHGFTGSTSELRLLGQHLAREGYTVKAPLLAGHGTCVQDMERTGWRDWVASATEAYHELRSMCHTIVLAGLSMGGTIAMYLARRYPCAAVITMCAPIFLRDRLAFLARPYSYVRRYMVKENQYPEHVRQHLCGYKETPLRCVGDLRRLVRITRRELPQITVPLLVMQAEQDRTIKPESADYIYRHAGSREKEIRKYPRSGHILTVDHDREQVFRDFAAFVKKHTQTTEKIAHE